MTKPRMSPATVAELKAAYPHATNPALAAEFGLSLESVKMFGWRNKLTKSATVIAELRREAVAKRNDEEVSDVRRRDAYLMLHHATQTAQEMADALGWNAKSVRWRASVLGLKCKPMQLGPKSEPIKGLQTPQQPAYRAPGWASAGARDAHARLTAADRAKLPATIPAGVKITRAPAFVDTRFAVAPGERVYGAGFAAAGIGRDVDTGRAWGQGA